MTVNLRVTRAAMPANVALMLSLAMFAWQASALADMGTCPSTTSCPSGTQDCPRTIIDSFNCCSTVSGGCCQYVCEKYRYGSGGPDCPADCTARPQGPFPHAGQSCSTGS